MSMPDHTEIVIQSLSQDIEQIKQHLQMQQLMIFQIIEALSAAGIISVGEEEAEEESDSIIIP